MKKKIIFAINNLNCGGAEKSLISLLQTMDYSKYEVDLFLFKHEGLFLSKIPKEVNLIDEPPEYKYFDMSIKTAIAECIKKGRLKIALSRICAGYIFKSEENRARCDQRVWKYKSNSLKNINKEYDIAIGYLEMSPIYFIIDKVKAKKKIGWIHTNYSNAGMDNSLDINHYKQLDYIVTVSDECKKDLEENFSDFINKIVVINNIVSPKIINNLSNNILPPKNVEDNECINIITVARLSHVKGIDLAINACDLLVTQGYKIKWSVLGGGSGQENDEYVNLVRQYNLQDSFELIGVKENPYPYVKAADIYVQPSRYEGKSIAIDEAKILKKPIIITNFSTAGDQIRNRENGLIVDLNPAPIADGIKELIENKELRLRFVNNLSKEKLGTESEILKFYKLLA